MLDFLKGKKPTDKSTDQPKDKMSTFGGMSAKELHRDIKKGDDGEKNSGSSLQSAKKTGPGNNGNNTQGGQPNLETNSQSASKQTQVSVGSSISDEVATLYAEGETKYAVELLIKHIHENQGKVDKRFWFMLMDIYQVTDQKGAFEKVALLFAKTFSCSPPSWLEKSEDSNKMTVGGKNMLIIDGPLKNDNETRFKEFLKSAREEKFCRIEASRLKFDSSDVSGLEAFLRLMTDLRKYKITSLLMGDNHVLQFCKQYILSQEGKTLNSNFVRNETLFWLLTLEIYQWKGRENDFEELALEYAMKFDESPPGYDYKNVMKLSASQINEAEAAAARNKVTLVEKNLNSNNLASLLGIIEEQMKTGMRAEVEFGHVERVDFACASSLIHFLQELQVKQENSEKKIIFKNPCEPVVALFDMIGLTEFLDIIPRVR